VIFGDEFTAWASTHAPYTTVTVDGGQGGKTAKRVESDPHGKGKRWRGRYVDELGAEHARSFTRKVDAQNWVKERLSAVARGTPGPS
jgi:hypothetical protein